MNGLLRAGLLVILLHSSLLYADEAQEISKLLKHGQLHQALERVDAALIGRPQDPQLRFLRGVILTEQNKTGEAITVFTKLTEDYPGLPEPYNNLAVLYAAQKQYDKARNALEMAIRTHPSYAIAYENLGDIYAKLASQAYDKALQIDSSNTSAQTKLSLIKDLTSSHSSTLIASNSKAGSEKEIKTTEITQQKPTNPNQEEVIKTILAWAKAWAKQDVAAYLAFYAKDFRTPGNQSRVTWESTRRERLTIPKKIEVRVESINIAFNDPQNAIARFRQYYHSDTLPAAVTTKVMVMQKTAAGEWRIQQERVGH